ncbi:unnamed protein product [Bursaphelenchus xylophilus]|nr:unnamed protein product [Bursaphelenchus xylophilus]CAG9130687.1 unnamed protein product [Bursaphelenchus xylophilus]
MGLTWSNSPDGRPSTALPLVGTGAYEVGCADIMIAPENENDVGMFARVFYPASKRLNVHEEAVQYPVWRPRKEYLDGLADYREMNPRKIHFFFDWVIGERRVPAGWHEPLFTYVLERERDHVVSIHGSKSSGQLSASSSEDLSDMGSRMHPSKSDANLINDCDPKFPVLIFSHGISGNRLCYSTYCSSLASYGFVVVAIEHRDRSSSWTFYLETDPVSGVVIEKPVTIMQYPAGEADFKARNKQLHKRVAECVRALNVMEELNLGTCGPADKRPKGSKIIYGQGFDWSQFKNRLLIDHAAVIGHSFGGAAALAAAAFSTDFQASVCWDGWLYPLEHDLYPRITQKTLMINAQKWQWAENVKRMMRLPAAAEKILFTLKDIVHQSFSDFSYLMPGYVGRKFALQGDLDPIQTGEAIMEITVTYLRKCFENIPAIEHLREVAKRYSHFVIEGTDISLEDGDNGKDHSADDIVPPEVDSNVN